MKAKDDLGAIKTNMQVLLQKLIKDLCSYDNKFAELAERMMLAGNGLYPVDLLASGIINRSMSLIDGFVILLQNDNFIAAAHLVRPYLDNYLRFRATWHVDNPHEFATKILQGERLDKLRDKKGKAFKDFYLVELATKDHPWIETVYKTTSGFIHFSKKHVFTASKLIDDEEEKVEFKFSKKDKYVPIESKIESVECMIEISKCIENLLEGWVQTKEIKG